jgi:predicted nucleic acid-binding protein
VYFLDTSVLLKSYLPEKGSETVQDAFTRLGGSLFISEAVALEAATTLSKHVRTKYISTRTYKKARKLLEWDFAHRFGFVPVEPAFPVAYGYAHQYRGRAPGPLDLLHLASAEHLQSLYPAETVWLFTSDVKLKRLAKVRDLDVFDPERDDLRQLSPPLFPPPN